MEIVPGIGIGPIKYGITEEKLTELLGQPDKRTNQEYDIEGDVHWSRDLWYSQRRVSFSFSELEDYRLDRITISGSGYPLFGRDLFALPQKTVKRFLVKATHEIPKFENWKSIVKRPHSGLFHDGLGVVFWFDYGNLSEMQCTCLFDKSGDTIWP